MMFLFFIILLLDHNSDKDSDDEDDDDDDDDVLDEDPILEHKSLKHYGGVNRVRVHTCAHAHI